MYKQKKNLRLQSKFDNAILRGGIIISLFCTKATGGIWDPRESMLMPFGKQSPLKFYPKYLYLNTMVNE
jgi:hypothetical protein